METISDLWAKLLKKYREILHKVKAFFNSKLKEGSNLGKEKEKKLLIGLLALGLIAISFGFYKVNEIKTRAFDIYIDEVKIGSTRDEEIIIQIVDELEKELCQKYDLDIVIKQEIDLIDSHVSDNKLSTFEEIKKGVKDNIGFLVSAYALVIDGEEIGVLKCENDVRTVVESVKDYHLSNIPKNSTIEEYRIVENIEYKQKDVPISQLGQIEDMIEYIKNGGEEIKTHIIEVGENFWTLAIFYGTTMEEIERANPDKDTRKLRPGVEVNLVVPISKITVETIEEVEYKEAINFDVKVESSSNMYRNETMIKVAGRRGENRILAKEIKHNGILVEKEVIKEERTKEPVTQVVVKGTKAPPSTASTGIFLMPTRGPITSPYGSRWGRMHYGIDIGAPRGTPIRAADGGTVVFSGWRGGYGYFIEISHANGYTTRYGHCNALHVKVGDKVFKGQHIADVGSTGNSTGPHLHFEVLRYGANQNPSNYVK